MGGTKYFESKSEDGIENYRPLISTFHKLHNLRLSWVRFPLDLCQLI